MTKGLFDPYVPDDDDDNNQDTSSQEFADWAADDEAWEHLEADLQILMDILEDDDNSQN